MSDDFRFDDGAELQISSTEAGVTVYQGTAGTQGRGAALLSPDQADQVAASLVRHAQQVRHADDPPTPELGAEPIAPVATEPADLLDVLHPRDGLHPSQAPPAPAE